MPMKVWCKTKRSMEYLLDLLIDRAGTDWVKVWYDEERDQYVIEWDDLSAHEELPF